MHPYCNVRIAILLHMCECACVWMRVILLHMLSVQCSVNIYSFHYHLKLVQAWRKKLRRESFSGCHLKCGRNSVRYSHCKMMNIPSSTCSDSDRLHFVNWIIENKSQITVSNHTHAHLYFDKWALNIFRHSTFALPANQSFWMRIR